jgi:hypothetical protein
LVGWWFFGFVGYSRLLSYSSERMWSVAGGVGGVPAGGDRSTAETIASKNISFLVKILFLLCHLSFIGTNDLRTLQIHHDVNQLEH